MIKWAEITEVRKTFEIDNDAVFDYVEELKVWIVGHLPIVDLDEGLKFVEMKSDYYTKAESIFQPFLTECDAAEGFRMIKFKAPYVAFGRRVDEADVFFIKCTNNGITYLASSNLVALRTLVLYINELKEWTGAYFDYEEMRAFALRVDKNKTNQMIGNINIYGGSYVDVHNNGVVNLNIDNSNVKVGDESREKEDTEGFPYQIEQPISPFSSQYDGKKLLTVYNRLKDEYVTCTEDTWLYLWGEFVHPLKKVVVERPEKPAVWSAMRGKKSALMEMVRVLVAKDCGEILKKTAKWFVFSDGTIPDPDILKSYELKGKSKKEFLQLVTVH